MMSLDGKLLINQAVTEISHLELDVADFSNGIYLLEINCNGAIYTSKICINR